ncbi:glycosyltransferase [Microbulbifer marinus]|uniref:glycosyltransferase n=1 Tax=Microbulbifer marinus TaxID=658218 RepID=UPI000B85D655|nr:glycosyltransferase [Microbulbifer marinus]
MLIPSPGETTAYTLIEALLNRCPVIADHSGYAEEYRPPEYLPKKLEPAYLVEKLQYALQGMHSLRHVFSATFERVATELTWSRWAGRPGRSTRKCSPDKVLL